MRILIAASEMTPFAKTGGLADVIGSLPFHLNNNGVEVAAVLPKYKGVTAETEDLGEITIPIASNPVSGRIEKSHVPNTKIPVYFIVQDHYYHRDGIYNDRGGDFSDNLERYTFFSRAVVEMVKRKMETPDLIHTNDWQTGLIPAYLKTTYKNDPNLSQIKTLFTIHNLAYQGIFPANSFAITGIDPKYFNSDGLEFYNQLCLIKAGIAFADYINTVSKKYAQEIQTEEFGCGLEGILQTRGDHLTGILNGVDYDSWSPEHDPLIVRKYTAIDVEPGKADNKAELLKRFNFPTTKSRVPLMGVVSRLATQKGLDILAAIVPELVEEGSRLIILGTGEPHLEEMFRSLQYKFPANCALCNTFDNKLAHLIEAGSDMFLMPSRYEPCGLNQLYSLRYGTIPVVRNTGGLADTIQDIDQNPNGNGFVFQNPDPGDLLEACLRAIRLYHNTPAWLNLVQRAMSQDFSWDRSAKEYKALYKKILTLS